MPESTLPQPAKPSERLSVARLEGITEENEANIEMILAFLGMPESTLPQPTRPSKTLAAVRIVKMGFRRLHAFIFKALKPAPPTEADLAVGVIIASATFLQCAEDAIAAGGEIPLAEMDKGRAELDLALCTLRRRFLDHPPDPGPGDLSLGRRMADREQIVLACVEYAEEHVAEIVKDVSEGLVNAVRNFVTLEEQDGLLSIGRSPGEIRDRIDLRVSRIIGTVGPASPAQSIDPASSFKRRSEELPRQRKDR